MESWSGKLGDITSLPRTKRLNPMLAVDGREINQVYRSKSWPRWFDEDPEEGEPEPCQYCDDYHRTIYVGAGERVAKDFAGVLDACVDEVAYYPPGGAPCLFWGEGVKWRRSKAMGEFGLGDLVGRGPPS